MVFSKRLAWLSAGLLLTVTAAATPTLAADNAGSVAQVFDQPISNIPGKSLIAVEVNYPPGGTSPSHRHAKSAFIMAYVISGAIRSQVEGEPVHVYTAGQTWYEKPGAHHLISENASKTEPAKMLAVLAVDTQDKSLTTFDKQ